MEMTKEEVRKRLLRDPYRNITRPEENLFPEAELNELREERRKFGQRATNLYVKIMKEIENGTRTYITPEEEQQLTEAYLTELAREIEKKHAANESPITLSDAVQQARTASVVAPLELTSADTLRSADIKPPEFIVDGLVPVGLTILAAPPKTGKSWLMLDMLMSIANGKPFWNRKTKGGQVLYCDLEGSDNRLKTRLTAMDLPLDEWSKNFSATHRMESVGDEMFAQIDGWMEKCDTPRAVVIDTWQRVKSGAKRGENAYETDTRIAGALQNYALKKNIAVIIVTHLRKRKQSEDESADVYELITGSNGAFGAADAACVIIGKRDTKDYTFRATGRDFEDGEISLRIEFDKTACKWQVNGDSEEIEREFLRKEFEKNPIYKAIESLLRDNGGKWCGRMSEIGERAQGFQTDTWVNPDARSIGKAVYKAEFRKQLFEHRITFTEMQRSGSERKVEFRYTGYTLLPEVQHEAD